MPRRRGCSNPSSAASGSRPGGGKGERTKYARHARITFRKDRFLSDRPSSAALEAGASAGAEGLPVPHSSRAFPQVDDVISSTAGQPRQRLPITSRLEVPTNALEEAVLKALHLPPLIRQCQTRQAERAGKEVGTALALTPQLVGLTLLRRDGDIP